jgi:sugar O-acyltransferase (sialic acid O-acetyltransferase NeuD family)
MLDAVEAVNERQPTWEFLGFLAADDRWRSEVQARGARILGDVDAVADLDVDYLIGIGDPAVREKVDRILQQAGRSPATLVHPAAAVGTLPRLGPGAYVAAGAVLTTNVELGRHAHVNVGASVSHDSRLGDYSFVGPGARLAGAVTVGTGAWVGVGATVLPGVTVGAWSVVGASAAVVRDVPERTTVVGVPARPRN